MQTLKELKNYFAELFEQRMKGMEVNQRFDMFF